MQHKGGFILLEAIITMCIVAIVLVPVLTAQYGTIARLSQVTDAMQYALRLRSLFVREFNQNFAAQTTTVQEPLQNGRGMLGGKVVAIDSRSALAGKFFNLYRLQGKAQWNVFRQQAQTELISFVHLPPKQQQ